MLSSPQDLFDETLEGDTSSQLRVSAMADPNAIGIAGISQGGMSLSSIAQLETSKDWMRWNREMRDYLIFAGYSTLLLAERADLVDTQPRPCAAIRSRCEYNAYTLVESHTTVFQMFQTLEEEFRPSGSGTFALLCQRFQEVTLASCKDVSEYVQEFRKIQNELRALDKSLVFPAPFLVHKFLHELGPAYNIFRTTFNQTRNILPEPEKPAVTFDVTVRAAIIEERT